MVQFRRAVEAHRDARLVWQAASEGRPMELAKRLRLGKLAGGMDLKREKECRDGKVDLVDARGAAKLGGHDECVKILDETS